MVLGQLHGRTTWEGTVWGITHTRRRSPSSLGKGSSEKRGLAPREARGGDFRRNPILQRGQLAGPASGRKHFMLKSMSVYSGVYVRREKAMGKQIREAYGEMPTIVT